MTSEELGEYVEAFIVESVTRVQGTGDDQYSSGDTQAFEGKDLAKVFRDAQEELFDVVNYAVMLSIKLTRLQRELEDKLDG